MSLEKELHQREFRNEFQKVLINIIHTNNYLVSKMNDVLKPYDITRQQYNVLRILRGRNPGHSTVLEIRERMLDKMSDASRIVERLRLKGLANREFGSKDKRSVEVTITQAGLTLLEQMEDNINSLEKLFKNLKLEDAVLLNESLDKIRVEKYFRQKKN
jgi:DNA-binding MarR family transcriptional regulator